MPTTKYTVRGPRGQRAIVGRERAARLSRAGLTVTAVTTGDNE